MRRLIRCVISRKLAISSGAGELPHLAVLHGKPGSVPAPARIVIADFHVPVAKWLKAAVSKTDIAKANRHELQG